MAQAKWFRWYDVPQFNPQTGGWDIIGQIEVECLVTKQGVPTKRTGAWRVRNRDGRIAEPAHLAGEAPPPSLGPPAD